MKNIKYSIELLEELVKNSKSYTEICFKLGLDKNTNQSWIRKKIKNNGWNIDHFIIRNKKNYYLNDNEIFIKDSKASSSAVRKRILKNNLIEYKCQLCENEGIWLGQKMPLILDHINGINNDCRLENLRWLCSNCDSIQPTYKSKNRKPSNKNKQKLLEKQQKEEQYKINKQNKINRILNSKINFSRFGWGTELGKYLNCTPQYATTFVKRYMEEFYKEICWKSKDNFTLKSHE